MKFIVTRHSIGESVDGEECVSEEHVIRTIQQMVDAQDTAPSDVRVYVRLDVTTHVESKIELRGPGVHVLKDESKR